MLDRFILTHRQVTFRDESRERIWDEGFRRAATLARTEIPLPSRSLIEGTRSVGENSTFYGLAARRAIKQHIGHVWREPDGTFLEFVVLCKWLEALQGTEDPELETARAALGTMIQRGLTQLLCDVDLDQWQRFHNFGFAEGLSARLWQIHIAGASAAAYVVMALASREEATVYLPTAHEDANFGIDLFWIEGRTCHAVSVKCVGGQDKHVLAWHVTERPPRNLTDRVSLDMRRIHNGARQFASQEDRACVPVLVHVAKPADGPIKLDRDWEGLTWPDQILATITRRIHVETSRALRG